MLGTCLGTSNYPWATIWSIGMAYFGQFGEKSKKFLVLTIWEGVKNNSLRLQWPLKTFPRAFRIWYEYLEACKSSYLFTKANGVTIWGIEKILWSQTWVVNDFWKLIPTRRHGDFKKVVFYQADRTISIASKNFFYGFTRHDMSVWGLANDHIYLLKQTGWSFDA